ncbi:MAG: DUF2723 domain-containing protein [Anaerolineae bacterium]|nr:DUF2723 domain-containing protein [Anaerolineae bacterium]
MLTGAGVLAFAVYGYTLAPTITWRHYGSDSGDLAAAVAVGGVPHPPGYPTYLLLGDLFQFLPFGDVAYRLNLLSATCAALTVVIVGSIIQQVVATASPDPSASSSTLFSNTLGFCAVSAALLLAFSASFWSQAVITEVYALNVFLAALLLYASLRVHPPNQAWLAPATFGLLGLSLGNHLSICFLAPALIGNLRVRWNRQLALTIPLAFFVGLTVYGVIPLRAAGLPPINWGAVTDRASFGWLVGGALYRHFLFALPPAYLPMRILGALQLLLQSFQWWGGVVGGIGWQFLAQRHPAAAYGSLASFGLFAAYAIGYNTTDSMVYLLPALLIFALWLGWGLYHLSSLGQAYLVKKWGYSSNLLRGVLLLLPLISLGLNFSQQDLRKDLEAYDYAQETLQQVEPEAIIIADNDPQTFALWYGRYGLGLRSDVAIINSNLLFYDWYRQILRRYHPRLRLEDEQGQPLTDLASFVTYNFKSGPIYLAFLERSQLNNYAVEPAGPVQRVQSTLSD